MGRNVKSGDNEQVVVFPVFDIVIVVNIFKSIGYIFFYYVCYYFQLFNF